jgi:carbon starvation protein CstA
MFLAILIFVLLIQVCNLYHYHKTREHLLNIIGIIFIFSLTLYEIITKKHSSKPHYDKIKYIQIIIAIISASTICYYFNRHI